VKTEFGSITVLPTAGKKYKHMVKALSADGNSIVRIMLLPNEAELLLKSPVGVINYAEELTQATAAIPAVTDKDGNVITPAVPGYGGGSVGFRFISVDNPRKHELDLIKAGITRKLTAQQEVTNAME
jgi:hypothetical protein